jgi:hypothetical protein
MGDMRNTYKFLMGYLRVRDHLGVQGANEKIMQNES